MKARLIFVIISVFYISFPAAYAVTPSGRTRREVGGQRLRNIRHNDWMGLAALYALADPTRTVSTRFRSSHWANDGTPTAITSIKNAWQIIDQDDAADIFRYPLHRYQQEGLRFQHDHTFFLRFELMLREKIYHQRGIETGEHYPADASPEHFIDVDGISFGRAFFDDLPPPKRSGFAIKAVQEAIFREGLTAQFWSDLILRDEQSPFGIPPDSKTNLNEETILRTILDAEWSDNEPGIRDVKIWLDSVIEDLDHDISRDIARIDHIREAYARVKTPRTNSGNKRKRVLDAAHEDVLSFFDNDKDDKVQLSGLLKRISDTLGRSIQDTTSKRQGPIAALIDRIIQIGDSKQVVPAEQHILRITKFAIAELQQAIATRSIDLGQSNKRADHALDTYNLHTAESNEEILDFSGPSGAEYVRDELLIRAQELEKAIVAIQEESEYHQWSDAQTQELAETARLLDELIAGVGRDIINQDTQLKAIDKFVEPDI